MNKIQILLIAMLASLQSFGQNPVKGFSVNAEILRYEGNMPANHQSFQFQNDRSYISFENTGWECKKSNGASADNETIYSFRVIKGNAAKAGVAVNFLFSNWTTDNYVIIPSAAYDGNRFDVLNYPYAPLFKPKDYNKSLPVTITNVPQHPQGLWLANPC